MLAMEARVKGLNVLTFHWSRLQVQVNNVHYSYIPQVTDELSYTTFDNIVQHYDEGMEDCQNKAR
jgi:hypothetical protein